MATGRLRETLKGVGKGGGDWCDWDAVMRVGGQENQTERIRGLKKKVNFTKHSQTWDLVIFGLGSEQNINIVSFHKAYCNPSFFVLR